MYEASKKNTALETNPFLPASRNNIGTPDPLAPNAKPIPSVYYSMPKRFNFNQWKERLVDSSTVSIEKDKELSDAAEKLLKPLLAPLYNQLHAIAEETGLQLSQEKVSTGDWVYKIAKTEKLLRELFSQELELVNKHIIVILEAFDKNTGGFKEKFMEAINENNVEKSREILIMRLKQEQEKINNQNALENEIVGAINEWRLFGANMKYIGEIQRITKGEDIVIKSLNNTEILNNISFIPGKGKKFNLLDAFFKGTWNGMVYSVKDGRHFFNPKDPDCCKTFIKYARAQNDGETTKVTLQLGGGTKADYAMYGTLTPDTSRVLHHKAMYFMATLKYGLEDIPSKELTKESVLAYYEKNGTVPEELKTVDLEMPPIPIVEFKNTKGDDIFAPSPADEAEFARWKGIRNALLECRLKEIEKFIEKTNNTPSEELTEADREKLSTISTLQSDFNSQLRKLEKLATPTAVEEERPNPRF